ncbi:MAG: thiamine pyrophosphate-dependent enzyme, partial [Thermodesulfobacteriota bacterium]|nr:thiamine pyrophosphate-dependent enzyme [Thermodesulfobacteriota bacterium]
HPLFLGPLGYNGSKAAMKIISKADVILALGNRLNPFSTLPSYGMEYWPTDAAIIQVDINPDRIGLTKSITVGIVGDAGKVARSILSQLSDTAGDTDREARRATVEKAKVDWDKELATMDHEEDDQGTTWNERCQNREPEKITARMAWRGIIAALPKEAIISSDIGNNCAIGNAYPTFEEGRKYLAPGMFGSCGYGFPAILGAKISKPDVPVVGFAGDGAFGISMSELTACGRDEWPAITMIIFRNFQWGAEKRNTTLWYHDNFVGTELDTNVSYAGIANACGLIGVRATTMDDLTEKLNTAIKAQMEEGKTTVIEVMTNQELGEPFRRDAMTTPVAVAGINKADMRPQKGA